MIAVGVVAVDIAVEARGTMRWNSECSMIQLHPSVSHRCYQRQQTSTAVDRQVAHMYVHRLQD